MRQQKALLSIFVGILVSIILFLAVYIVISNQLANSSTQEYSVSYPASYSDSVSYPSSYVSTPTNSEIETKIFFVRDNNIWLKDLLNNLERQLTFYPKNKDYSPAYDESGMQLSITSIAGISIINESEIGYGKCASVKGNSGCGIYILNIDTSQIIEKQLLGPHTNLFAVEFYSMEKYVFNSLFINQENKQPQWEVTLVEKDTQTKLESILVEAWGRGSMPYDSEKMRFSQDGNSFFQISTASPRSIFDSNIYIYNLVDKTRQIVRDSTQPNWLSNDSIVYRGHITTNKHETGYIYIYNINTKSSDRLKDITQTASNPQVINSNEFIYEDSNGVFKYRISDGSAKELLNVPASTALISQQYLQYSEIIQCNETDIDCGGIIGPFYHGKVQLFDLEKEIVISIPEIELEGYNYMTYTENY